MFDFSILIENGSLFLNSIQLKRADKNCLYCIPLLSIILKNIGYFFLMKILVQRVI